MFERELTPEDRIAYAIIFVVIVAVLIFLDVRWW
jgi:hypothetical protein